MYAPYILYSIHALIAGAFSMYIYSIHGKYSIHQHIPGSTLQRWASCEGQVYIVYIVCIDK